MSISTTSGTSDKATIWQGHSTPEAEDKLDEARFIVHKELNALVHFVPSADTCPLSPYPAPYRRASPVVSGNPEAHPLTTITYGRSHHDIEMGSDTAIFVTAPSDHLFRSDANAGHGLIVSQAEDDASTYLESQGKENAQQINPTLLKLGTELVMRTDEHDNHPEMEHQGRSDIHTSHAIPQPSSPLSSPPPVPSTPKRPQSPVSRFPSKSVPVVEILISSPTPRQSGHLTSSMTAKKPSSPNRVQGTHTEPGADAFHSRGDRRPREKPPRFDDYVELESSIDSESPPPPPNRRKKKKRSADEDYHHTKSKKQKFGSHLQGKQVAPTEHSIPGTSSPAGLSDCLDKLSDTVPPLVSAGNGNHGAMIQRKACQHSKFPEGVLPCVACVKRKSGDSCRFRWLRAFAEGSTPQELRGPARVISDSRPEEEVQYPTVWNIPPTDVECHRILRVVAKALLPVLTEEIKHLSQAGLMNRNKELDCRITCDFCMTSVFTCGWLCKQCGREFCSDCYTRIVHISKVPTPRTQSKHPDQSIQRLMCCYKKLEHNPPTFSPVSRFKLHTLQTAVHEMDAIVKQEAQGEMMPMDLSAVPYPRRDPADPEDPSGVASLPFYVFSKGELTEDIFQRLWIRGETLVVTGLLDAFTNEWTPQSLIERYGNQKCDVVDCKNNESRTMTVRKFFKQFGHYEGRKKCLKLKDWPPTSEFSQEFPELYQDFANAVPIPNYTRRDGILNIASHFPVNEKALIPDIGPKMYNAFEASETAGGKGSTRLHMDMADAVNIMLYASPRRNGTPGTAVWDIFRAEDSIKIREYLVDKFGPAETDPIHSQYYYFDSEMRKELHDKYGVKSWRIYQKPGEAVFIPAGCAHQVCNLADCIKVAVDFVSPENVQRCEKLTKEFREQNQAKAWKEDVLELWQTMFHAWNSMRKVLERIRPDEEMKDAS
ncbi:hypothetical protein FRB99_008328 [Tulasnella sp. 403]|nr:hypothetical protein FRB99_008328 [Tulasnella sp. 403]